MAPAVDILVTGPLAFSPDSFVTLLEQACMLLCPMFCVPVRVFVLVVPLSDLHTGAVEIDPDIASNVCSSLNPDPRYSPLMSDPEKSLDDLVDTLALIQNNNWEISNECKNC